jgi:hypothetical protein
MPPSTTSTRRPFLAAGGTAIGLGFPTVARAGGVGERSPRSVIRVNLTGG